MSSNNKMTLSNLFSQLLTKICKKSVDYRVENVCLSFLQFDFNLI